MAVAPVAVRRVHYLGCPCENCERYRVLGKQSEQLSHDIFDAVMSHEESRAEMLLEELEGVNTELERL